MKPTRNRYYCKACGHSKMLFQSEKEALRFIDFNAKDFEGKVPARAYYCNICMGWHLTSKEESEYFATFKSDAEKLVDQYIEKHKVKLQSKIERKAMSEAEKVVAKIEQLIAESSYDIAFECVLSNVRSISIQREGDSAVLSVMTKIPIILRAELSSIKSESKAVPHSFAKSRRKNIRKLARLAVAYDKALASELGEILKDYESIESEPKPKKEKVKKEVPVVPQQVLSEEDLKAKNQWKEQQYFQKIHRKLSKAIVSLRLGLVLEAKEEMHSITLSLNDYAPGCIDKDKLLDVINRLSELGAEIDASDSKEKE